MFEISATELLVIAAVALVVIGPKDLPDMLRGLGRFVRKLRNMAGDFQRQLDQAGFEDVRKGFEEVRSLTSPSGAIARTIASSLEQADAKTTVEQKALGPAQSSTETDGTSAQSPATQAGVTTTLARVSEAGTAGITDAGSAGASTGAENTPAASAAPGQATAATGTYQGTTAEPASATAQDNSMAASPPESVAPVSSPQAQAERETAQARASAAASDPVTANSGSAPGTA
ncbi:Sec-independent protein translocase protein TatB [Rhodoligotrophos ferricapiens]|uniref:Sec-independent protein translocase protein TatB n=1 Tax=Rhodoligotrophos ferricapiens TaxID=3069264 RepID=UPI00315D0176